MTDTDLTLFCLVDGDATSNAFPIKIPSNHTVNDLKNLIKFKKSSELDDIPADKLTVRWVHIPDENHGSAITIDTLEFKAELNDPRKQLSKLFSESPDDNTYILVQRLTPVCALHDD
ncbi:hypothetical protein BG003_011154 [Podila horticola]|nr:hypothetical protein BG003_011154 [Podila horticola]